MKTEYRFAFASQINLETANHFRTRIATILDANDFGRLIVLFSGEGGSTDQSVALYNFLRELPVDVHMHAIGHVGSAAIPVFLGGSKRTCVPTARFFFHEYDWGFAARQTLARIDEAVQRLKSDIEISGKIINERTKVPTATIKAMEGGDPVIIEPEHAKKLEIVEDVLSLGPKSVDGLPVAVWT